MKKILVFAAVFLFFVILALNCYAEESKTKTMSGDMVIDKMTEAYKSLNSFKEECVIDLFTDGKKYSQKSMFVFERPNNVFLHMTGDTAEGLSNWYFVCDGKKIDRYETLSKLHKSRNADLNLKDLADNNGPGFDSMIFYLLEGDNSKIFWGKKFLKSITQNSKNQYLLVFEKNTDKEEDSVILCLDKNTFMLNSYELKGKGPKETSGLKVDIKYYDINKKPDPTIFTTIPEECKNL